MTTQPNMKRTVIRFFLLVAIILSLFTILSPTHGAQVNSVNGLCFVKEDAGGIGDGSSWANAYSTWLGVYYALENSSGCTQIWVAAGTYMPGFSSTDTFQLKNGVVLYGGFAGTESSLNERDIIANETILSGNIQGTGSLDNSYHVVTGSGTDNTAVLDGFTVADGYADGTGSNNKGAGMYNSSGSPTVRNVTFKDNYATTGAGMYNSNSTPAISGVLFINNTATALGGGMYNGMSNVTLANVTFAGNQASNGGGIYNAFSNPTLLNLTFTANNASSHGGGIFDEWAAPDVHNTIFWGNTATTAGGQIYDDEDSDAAISDSVVEGGFAGGTNITTGDPLLGTLGDYGGRMQAIPLQAGSPAIDAGDEATCTIVDQRGISRSGQGASCDIGAFEYLPVLYAKAGGRTAGLCYTWGFGCELRYALASAEAGKEIWVQAGTHYPTDGTDRNATFQLKRDVEVYGGFAGTETLREQRDWLARQTILSGDIGALNDLTDNSYHVVTGSGTDGTAVLDGFVIKYGYGDDGGGMHNYEGSPTVRNTVFALNYGDAGGGMYNYLSTATVENVQFIENEAKGGAGMYNHESSPTLTNVTFTGNAAHDLDFASGGNYGGGMLNNLNSHPILRDVIFDGNAAVEYGGGMFCWNGSNPDMLRVTFTGNSAGSSGGGLAARTSSPVLTTVTFTQNTAVQGGGMSNQNNATPVLEDVRFIGNSAVGPDGQSSDLNNGGGMFNQLSTPRLISVTFRTNNAYNGGGIHDTGSSPQLTGVTFDGNVAKYGGGMFNTDSSHPTLLNVTFTGDHAEIAGGGMYNGAGSNPQLSNVLFQSETTPTAGASGTGGGMYNDASSPTLTDVTFDQNASRDGGGMFNSNGSGPVLTRVTFSQNDGGGVYNIDGDPQFTNVTFQGNHTYEGGGMHNVSSSPTLSHVTFSKNYASLGGGVYNRNSAPKIDNSIFWGNQGYERGDQIFNHDNIAGDPPVLSNNVIQGGCPANADCTAVITADPVLGTLGNHGGATQTILLGPGSSAMNSANDTYTYCPADDQRGVPRAQSILCDVGAVERIDLNLIGTLPSPSTAHLNWNDTAPPHEGYRLYRSNRPYAGYAAYASPAASEEDVPVLATQNYYYEVYGLLDGTTADRSNRVGVFTFGLVPGN